MLLLFLLFCIPVVSWSQDTTVEELVHAPVNKEGDLMVRDRKVSPAAVKKLKEDDAFWYAKGGIPKRQIRQEGSQARVPVFEQTWFQTLLWLVIIGSFAGVLMWFLVENKVGLFRRKPVSIAGEGTEEEHTDIYTINYQKEIDKAVREGNFRAAIRLMYLRLLKDLSERNIIHYSQEKTNFDYLLQLNPTRYYSAFFRITRNYEYSWYGQFNVDESTFKVIQQDFNQFNRQLS